MSDLERITGLINDIYDAALDASLWPQVLRRTMTLLDGASAAILILAPHLRRAVAIARTLERSESKSAALDQVLEQLSSAVVFVDRAGRLLHANGPAAKMLAASEVLRWSGGKPRPGNERAAAHLEAVLASAHRGQPAPDCGALSVTHCTKSGERMTVHVLPLAAGTRRAATAPSSAAAAILVSRETWDLPRRLQLAARLYALTPAESRVVSVLLTGCTVGGAARVLGIKEATVKTHLQHVFDKTGTRRQIDLAQRIADCGWSSLSDSGSADAPAAAARSGAGLDPAADAARARI